MNATKKGFTLVEVLVVAPIVILTIGAFIALVVTLTGNTLASRGASVLQYNVSDALDRIENDVRISVRSLAANNIAFTASNPQGYIDTPDAPSSGSTVGFTNNNATSSGASSALILQQYATAQRQNAAPDSTSILYIANTPNPCSGNYKANTAVSTNIIYFIANNTLWRRTVTPATTPALCGGTALEQQPSCAPATTHSFCKTQDIRLVEGVSRDDFTVQYFPTITATAPNSTAVSTSHTIIQRNNALMTTDTVSVSITAKQTVAGRDIERSGSMRTSRLNSI